MDRIRLRGLRFYGHHGVTPEEREVGQWYRADVDLYLDLRSAGATDDLKATVDYGAVARRVLQVGSEERFALIEALADRIAGLLLREYPSVQSVRVSVRKAPPATLNVSLADFGELGYATFEVTRTRGDVPSSQRREK